MPTNLLDLEPTFGSLFKEDIPIFERIQPSIITILKAYGETNLSNLLGYLFRGEDHPLLKRIFLRALIDCFDFDPEIPKDDDIETYLNEVKVNLEYETQFGRIDILIRRENRQQSKCWAVILENKIHHTLNNDLDDYFYTVGRRYKILPQQIAVIILALRDTFAGMQKKIPSQVILHRTLKENVHQLYQDHFREFNDRSSTLILTEYLRHIDDMYLVSTNHANNASFIFFAQHKVLINKLCSERPDWSFDNLSVRNQKFLFENLHRADRLVALQEHILKSMENALDHYLGLTGRNVGGNSAVRYFRGSGSSFELIRYQLDYRGYFSGQKSQLEFKVWLHASVLKAKQIDTTDNIDQALAKVKARYMGSNTEWEQIYTSNYTPLHADIIEIIKENITEDWLSLEDILSKAFEYHLTEERYAELRLLLEKAGYNCEEHNEGIIFKDDILDFFLRYKVHFVAPDYTDITLYVNVNQWTMCWQKLKNSTNANLFTQFDSYQSWHLPELRDEKSLDSILNFDALAKRSYRETDMEKGLLKFQEELKLFKTLEAELEKCYDG